VQGISKDDPRDHTSSAEGRVEEPLPEAPRWAVPAIAAIASNAAQGDPSQHPSRH